MRSIILGTTSSGGAARIDLARLVESRLLLQANSGGGKSWAIRRLLEQSHGQVQHLVLDIEGEFHTLRQRFDYVLAARTGGDTLADPRTAAVLARRLLELGVSAILDLYELKAHERVRFVRLFLEAIVDAPKDLWHPTLIVVDEAHHFCPQTGDAESASAVIDLMTRGRKRGFCGVLATQRLSKLHKDAAAEANVKLIGRAGLDVDLKRAAEELGISAKDERLSIRSLPAGHFFAFGPGLSDEVTQIVVGPVETTHPRPGQRAAPVPPAREKVKRALAQLADLPKEAEAEAKTVAELRQENATLKRQLAAKPAPPAVKVETIERWILTEKHVKRLEDVVMSLAAAQALAADTVAKRQGVVATEVNNLVTLIRQRSPSQEPLARYTGRPTDFASARKREAEVLADPGSREGIPAPRLRILDSLAFLEQIGVEAADRIQVAFFSDASPSSSAYQNNLGALKSGGLLTYPGQGTLALTDAGRGVADAGAAPQTTEDLHRLLRSKVPAPRWRILEALAGYYPQPVERVPLAEAVGASATSSAYQNNLGALRSLGLIDYVPGGVVATKRLFLEGR
jgi:hypothetical protein